MLPVTVANARGRIYSWRQKSARRSRFAIWRAGNRRAWESGVEAEERLKSRGDGQQTLLQVRHDPSLPASRPRSLWFRLRFVFPVCHWFPVVVSHYFNHASLTLGPSQIRTCAVNASGSQISLAFRTPSFAIHRDQVCQTLRIYQRMKVRETREIRPAHIAFLTPAAQVTLRQPTNFRAIRHQ